MSLAAVLATAAAATTLFNELVFYFAGSTGKDFLQRRVGRHPRYGRVQHWVNRRSVVLLLFSRYLFGFRLAIPVACGASGMRAVTFTTVNAAGAVLWVVPVGLVGFFLGNVLESFWHGVRHWEWHIACALLVLLTALLAWKDPEFRGVSLAFTHIRRFTVLSTHRIRHRFGGRARNRIGLRRFRVFGRHKRFRAVAATSDVEGSCPSTLWFSSSHTIRDIRCAGIVRAGAEHPEDVFTSDQQL